jgi:transposase
MANTRRHLSSDLKAKVALELIKETDTVSAICSKFQVHPTQAGKWKQQAVKGMELLFSERASDELKKKDETIDELYRQIGQLKVELDWVKKKTGS